MKRSPSISRPELLHDLPPVCGNDPRVLVLGSFPSVISLGEAKYYGNPKNQFWRIMEAHFPVPASHSYLDRVARLTEQGVALWDVIGVCERPGSADSRIRNPVPNDIAGFFRAHPSLRLVALNGTVAGRLYHKLVEVPGIPSVTLPSTSPANAAMTFAEKVRAWRVIAEVSANG
jgi:double-stranded uracil-DNA glycosylase